MVALVVYPPIERGPGGLAAGCLAGWRFALLAAWWTALAGAALALTVWGGRSWRARREREVTAGPTSAPAGASTAVLRSVRAEPFAYVPAILAGTVAAFLTEA